MKRLGRFANYIALFFAVALAACLASLSSTLRTDIAEGVSSSYTVIHQVMASYAFTALAIALVLGLLAKELINMSVQSKVLINVGAFFIAFLLNIPMFGTVF